MNMYIRQLDIEKPRADWNDVEKTNTWHNQQGNRNLDPRLVTIADVQGGEEHFIIEGQEFRVIGLGKGSEYDFSSNEQIGWTW